MLHKIIRVFFRAAVLIAATAALAHAHHPMDYATPATALEGLLSGLGHPVIGVDHLLFIAGAGVLAARFTRGYLLPLVFVVASVAVVGMRYLGVEVALNEFWIAGSLVILGAIMLAAREITGGVTAGLFLVTGALHGNALAEAIVGAERTPLFAYLIGLTLIQCAIALSAWWIASWLATHHPRMPIQRLAGAAVGAAGLVFAGLAVL